MDAREFALILDRFALSGEGYRKVRRGVQKRIVRHMQALGCPSMRAYLERLDADGEAETGARRLLDVSISRFFRDGEVWQVLGEEILPSLAAAHPAGLRIWSAGCALGQEVYSIRILWALLSEKAPSTSISPRLARSQLTRPLRRTNSSVLSMAINEGNARMANRI